MYSAATRRYTEVHGALQGRGMIVFHRELRDEKLSKLNFSPDMQVRQGSPRMPPRCIHGNAGDNTDDPGATIRDDP